MVPPLYSVSVPQHVAETVTVVERKQQEASFPLLYVPPPIFTLLSVLLIQDNTVLNSNIDNSEVVCEWGVGR